MPLYRYKCTQSHEHTDLRQHDDKPPECPECGSETRRVIGRTSFKLEGGGWFSDGYSGGENG